MVSLERVEALDDFRILTGNQTVTGTPVNMHGNIQPTWEMNQRVTKFIKTSSSATTGAITLFTADSQKYTLITYMNLGFTKDAACDAATGNISISATIGGLSTAILRIPVLTLTAQSEVAIVSLPFPLLIDRGAVVTVSGTFTAGNLIRQVVVGGFLV